MNKGVSEIVSESHGPRSGITWTQILTLVVCFIMNILDGMDVLVIAFCGPAIADQWNMTSEMQGLIYSAGLAGMTVGALFLAPFADRIGRKKIILICALLMGVSMYLTAYSTGVGQLIIYRAVSGVGIGCMLACTTALADEFAPDNNYKTFWVNFVLAGYPTGAVITGLLGAEIIPQYGWQMMFKIAGIASIVTIPLILFFLEESVQFYLKRQPEGALEKANAILLKINQPSLSQLPPPPQNSVAIPVGKILEPEFRVSTIQLWTAIFLSFGALYFLVNWIPQLSEKAGLSRELAIYAGTAFNGGAFFGICTQGYFSSNFGMKKTISAFLIGTGLLMVIFRVVIGTDWILPVFALLGFGIQGGFVGLYAVAARLYPTEFKSTGIGWGIGLGRFGAVVGPALGGVLIGMGMTMANSFTIFAVPCIIAGIVVMYLASNRIT